MKTLAAIGLFTAFLLIPVSAVAQSTGSGLFVPESSFDMQVMNMEPVCWVNDANELNAFIQRADRAEIITMVGEQGAEMPVLPKIIQVACSSSGFMLIGEDGTGYFFGIKHNEKSTQIHDIMKHLAKGEIRIYNGIAIARHQWLEPKGPELEELRAAKSIYDVLGD